ncbi:MAG: M23 family metallopeptidase [Candidatus Roizmanbacteria bacterium]|nr:M23 family metallopeptidase [Candidatus Roizmanbacteria bacterium]
MIKPFNGNYKQTQGFGGNPDTYAQFGLKGHNGLDYELPNNTEVIAPHNGKVIEAAFDSTGYGNYIKIESDIEGSVVAHLLKQVVSVGQEVKEGQLIGYSDNTGFSTGPHLHWGYYRIPRNRQNGYLGFIDQTPFIDSVEPAPPTTDRRDYWFDRMDSVTFMKPHEEITDSEVEKFVTEYPSQLLRSGLWDQVCKLAGIEGDTNVVTEQELFDKIQDLKLCNEVELREANEKIAEKIAEIARLRQAIKDIITKLQTI